MQLSKIILLSGISLFILASCGGDASGDSKKEEANCLYSYNHSTTDLTWTAYKTLSKVPVAGGFNNIKVTAESAYSQKEVIESINFVISTSSVETNDIGRNQKIDSLFFGFSDIKEIKGKILKLNENGKADIQINMGIPVTISGDYKIEGNKFSFNAEIDLISWEMLNAVENLNQACEEVHRGAEGEESKLWSNVSLSLTTVLSSDCNK